MAETFQLPQWMLESLDPSILEQLNKVAQEKRAAGLAPLLHTLTNLAKEVEQEVRTTGTSEKRGDLYAAYSAFVAAAFPGSGRGRKPGSTNNVAKDDSVVASQKVYLATRAEIQKLGHNTLGEAKRAGVNVDEIKARVSQELGLAPPEPVAATA